MGNSEEMAEVAGGKMREILDAANEIDEALYQEFSEEHQDALDDLDDELAGVVVAIRKARSVIHRLYH